jgi:hypothetical protein
VLERANRLVVIERKEEVQPLVEVLLRVRVRGDRPAVLAQAIEQRRRVAVRGRSRANRGQRTRQRETDQHKQSVNSHRSTSLYLI